MQVQHTAFLQPYPRVAESLPAPVERGLEDAVWSKQSRYSKRLNPSFNNMKNMGSLFCQSFYGNLYVTLPA